MADQSKTTEEVPNPSDETPPKQKLGDTPVAPWNMPSAEEKKAAEPIRKVLRDALSEVDSPEKADETVRQLKDKTAGQTTAEVVKAATATPLPEAGAKMAEAAQQSAATTSATAAKPGISANAADILVEATRVTATAKGRDREAAAQAVQEVLNPEQQGAPNTGETKQRKYLREAILRRLKPMDAIDARLFLLINHLPHNRFLNRFFYFITRIFSVGAVWLALLQLLKLRNRPVAEQALRETTLPLILSTLIVEIPLKRFFRRRRPFIKDIEAIAVGIKPNSWSFPSGHAAAAFAGAWLLKRYFPKQRGLLYAFALLGVFSRVYLGDHYPGDVATGSIFGIVFAKLIKLVMGLWRKK